MAFSLHTDSKGIMDLVQHVQPRAVALVHGEEPKMRFLQQRIQESLHVPCFMPANGEALQVMQPAAASAMEAAKPADKANDTDALAASLQVCR